MPTVIKVMPPKEFEYKIVLDDVDGMFNQKGTVAFKKIDNGFTVEYQYESFADEGKYSFKAKLFQDFIAESVKDLSPMEVYMCYIGVTETINKVSERVFVNIDSRPQIKVQDFDELKDKIPFFK